jgi:glycosyltransferase involved in cell wall biosynthesis
VKIGIDVRVLGTNKALERYTSNLVTELLNEDKKNNYLLFTDDPNKVDQWQAKCTYFLLPKKRVLTDHLRFHRLTKNTGVDLVFHPDNTEFLHCHPKSIVTLHDVIPWKFPEMILSQNPILRARQTLYFKLQETALRKASHIITVSETSKKDISQILGIDDDKIRVIYEGIEDSFEEKTSELILRKYNISGEYIFYIGGFSPHKNVLSLVKAFAILSGQGREETLVLGGRSEETKGGQSAFREIMTEIKRNKLEDQVIFTGFIPEEDLPAFYQHSKAFVFPSLYEGFGFPPLEAMKAGAPVISSARASLGEILTKGALLTDVSSPQKLATAILKVLTDKDMRSKLQLAGKNLVSELTWKKTASQTIEVFNRFAN